MKGEGRAPTAFVTTPWGNGCPHSPDHQSAAADLDPFIREAGARGTIVLAQTVRPVQRPEVRLSRAPGRSPCVGTVHPDTRIVRGAA